MRSVRHDYRDISQEQVERIRELMDAHVRDCLVTEYEPLIADLQLPDPDDRHVLAAAIRAGADVIVTANLADFPPEALRPHGVEAQHADDFIMGLFDVGPEAVCEAANRQRASLKNPPLSVEAYLASLERQGIPKTVAALRGFADRL
ncbi:MAG TPA: PIN domain-containing protein [Pirellulales bacterium]|nr:PIN domain-containing protein [Pirellulales bacterium]